MSYLKFDKSLMINLEQSLLKEMLRMIRNIVVRTRIGWNSVTQKFC